MSRLSILDSLSVLRAAVIGDLMLDHYVRGKVRRISPEAPVPVLDVTGDSYSAGGAANVAINLARLGVKTTAVGVMGNDDARHKLQGLLTSEGVDTGLLETEHSPPTIVKTRIVAHNQQVCRVDREASQDRYHPLLTASQVGSLEDLLSRVDLIIFSDYAKGVFHQAFLDACLSFCRHKTGLLTAMDPKPSHKLNHRGIGLLTPNLGEAAALASLPNGADPLSKLPEISKTIHERYAPKNLVITLGPDGMALSRDGEIKQTLPTEAQEVFDVSGAGDTVIAVLAAALASGADLRNAAALANHAAGCVVAHAGTVPVNRDELKARLDTAASRQC